MADAKKAAAKKAAAATGDASQSVASTAAAAQSTAASVSAASGAEDGNSAVQDKRYVLITFLNLFFNNILDRFYGRRAVLNRFQQLA